MVAQLGDEADPQERERLARRVEAALASINALFSGLLDVSKLDAGAVQPALAAFPVQQILDRMDVALASAAHAKGLELRIRPSAAWVCSDPVLLERIVGNLVGNAVRYTDKGGLLVGCRHTAAGLRIAVWDTGIGIAPDKIEQVFEEFYQITEPGVVRGEGLGLGLAIVSRLAALLGHAVQLRSTPGRGSCFSVTVPLAAPQMATELATAISPGTPLRGRRVLIIDNDEQVLDSTARLLESWGCVVQALHGATDAALDGMADAGAPDIVLVDMHLDDGDDGVSAVARLRNRYGHALPALIITGDVAAATQGQLNSAGLPMLEKPVSALRLRTVLTRLLQRT
jgi:CheY-like chemotaxis protein